MSTRGLPRHVVALRGPDGAAEIDDATRDALAVLLRAATAEGRRCGVLVLDDPAPPERLLTPVRAGAAAAVRVGAGGALAYKPRRGAPVLRDVLRSHFLGCDLVVLEGEVPAGPAMVLSPLVGPNEPPRWRLSCDDGRRLDLSGPELVARLARPQLIRDRRSESDDST